MNPQTFIFIGRSGCGKGTQTNFLIEELKNRDSRESLYISTGQVFRDLGAGGTYSGEISKKIYETGELQPEFLAIWAWSNLLVEKMKENQHLIIDGMPRKVHEACVFDSAVSFYNREKPKVVYINVSKQWAEERLLARGRGDDNKEDIEARMKWFERDVIPVLDYFKSNGGYDFFEINGEQSIELVRKEITDKVFS